MKTFPGRRRSDSQDHPLSGAMRALIVEDDVVYRARIGFLARKVGFDVDEASDPHSAIALLSRAHYDLVAASLETSGLDLIGRFRTEEGTKNAYAVLTTLHDDVEKKIAALAAGYDDFLPKSASELEVVAKLATARRLVARQHTFDHMVRELYGLATRDELTGVFNRRFFVTETERLLRRGHPVTIVLFDLDDFKPINDRCGHLTGDRILRDLGALFQRCTRPEDLVARYGGDEFVMVVAGVPFEEVETVVGRLVSEIRHLQWSINGEEFHIGVTVGVGSSHFLAGGTLMQLLDAADRDLYKNKWVKKHPERTAARKGTDDQVMPLPKAVAEVTTQSARPTRRPRAEATDRR